MQAPFRQRPPPRVSPRGSSEGASGRSLDSARSVAGSVADEPAARGAQGLPGVLSGPPLQPAPKTVVGLGACHSSPRVLACLSLVESRWAQRGRLCGRPAGWQADARPARWSALTCLLSTCLLRAWQAACASSDCQTAHTLAYIAPACRACMCLQCSCTLQESAWCATGGRQPAPQAPNGAARAALHEPEARDCHAWRPAGRPYTGKARAQGLWTRVQGWGCHAKTMHCTRLP